MLNHLFNTYVTKTEPEASATSSSSIQTKCNELDTRLSATRSVADTNKSVIGDLQKELNILKYKKWESGVIVGRYISKQSSSASITLGMFVIWQALESI